MLTSTFRRYKDAKAAIDRHNAKGGHVQYYVGQVLHDGQWWYRAEVSFTK